MPSSSPSQPSASALARREIRSVFDLVETFEHDGVDVEHGAADAGMLVLAGRGVGTTALSELDFAFVEVNLELVPLRGGDRPVFPGGSGGPPTGEVCLVVPDDVFVEDGDVAVGGLDVEVPQQSGTDVDRQAVDNQIGGKQAPEVMRGEPATHQFGMLDGQGVAEFRELLTQRAGGDHFGALSDRALEQERLRFVVRRSCLSSRVANGTASGSG
jgi:hypothetical protein